ncbi:PAN domain-containing protein [Ditylenchus destructor]|uniref:PAN domain-containing protein n=1 Tax=Ditylenchus destructor TaxID=166010 RepID=A0AAD4N401_9BILA|nr:PAN domain-containing protein [Ditylenchus destructor]
MSDKKDNTAPLAIKDYGAQMRQNGIRMLIHRPDCSVSFMEHIAIIKGCFPMQQPFSYPSTYSYAPPPPAYGSPYSSASKSRMASDTHTFVENNNLDEDVVNYEPQTQQECIQRYIDSGITCASAFENRTPSSEAECHRICADNAVCRSFQFDSAGMVCELFDLEPSTRALPDFMTVSAPPSPFADDPFSTGGNYKRHKRFAPTNGIPLDSVPPNHKAMASSPIGIPQGPIPLPHLSSSVEKCEPAIIPSNGKILVVLDPDCGKSGLFSSSPMLPTLIGGGMEPFTSANPHRMPAGIAGANTAEVIPEIPDCPDGSRARIQLIDGISLVEERPVANIQLGSADVCLHVCRSNAHLDGTRFAKTCRAATFDRNTGRCEIINDAISPNGELNYVPNPDSIYFEKFCVSESELPLGCDDVVHRIPQHTLDSRAAGTGAVVTAKSQTECIRRCITAQKRLGFECASASFYFDWSADNCYLSRFTRINRPDIYVAERRHLVDYLELAPCMRHAWQHDDAMGSSWSPWSDCDANSSTRNRRRNCTNCVNKVETQTEPCINKMSLMKEFPGMLNAIEAEDAKRFKPATAPGEPALFGEQDYENQEEVSFFGPPHQPPKGNQPARKDTKGEDDSVKCDPHRQCCQKPTDVSFARGCSIGYRILSDGKNVPCLPESCQ